MCEVYLPAGVSQGNRDGTEEEVTLGLTENRVTVCSRGDHHKLTQAIPSRHNGPRKDSHYLKSFPTGNLSQIYVIRHFTSPYSHPTWQLHAFTFETLLKKKSSMYMWVWSCLCHRAHVSWGPKDNLCEWVPGIEFRLSGLCRKHFYSLSLNFFFLFLPGGLGVKNRISCLLGNCSTMEPTPGPDFSFSIFFIPSIH